MGLGHLIVRGSMSSRPHKARQTATIDANKQNQASLRWRMLKPPAVERSHAGPVTPDAPRDALPALAGAIRKVAWYQWSTELSLVTRRYNCLNSRGEGNSTNCEPTSL